MERTLLDRYRLSADELFSLNAELGRFDGPLRNGYRLVAVDGDHRFADLGRDVERRVFDEAYGHKFAYSAESMVEMYGPYESDSRFFLVYDQGERSVVAAMRVIDSTTNTKTLTDLETGYTDLVFVDEYARIKAADRVWDVATIASDRRMISDRLASKSLYFTLLSTAVRNDVDYLVSFIDEKPLSFFLLMGIPFENCISGRDYLDYEGCLSRPVYARVPDIGPSMMRAAMESSRSLVKEFVAQVVTGYRLVPVTDVTAAPDTIDLRTDTVG